MAGAGVVFATSGELAAQRLPLALFCFRRHTI